MKIYKCKICDKEISRYSAHYGLGMCLSCSHKGKKLTKKDLKDTKHCYFDSETNAQKYITKNNFKKKDYTINILEDG